ncbi:MATH domain and coiled-coil domain-containing protein [Raphanus sativus]|uniref:MATH domain and coiled-coil domain-containing protein At2g42460-like n=1 Tax=Raphanus sativus TaxID=3726 RepID=A0A6J0MPC7_RAPSA|nr:MATH domain and coiled-coil domain-containing protein At2g42460-like [Raphanus sativus]XP_056856079.1 MATH domain and coiled-coil domain-containing protein At2g42460-like [Raphanus sativus]KAJ4873181.1 MATH domain and coiled-coil domain-containing protein [Raphanus sativus]
MEKALSWEINNFSEKNSAMKSDRFSSGGCEWYLCVYPEGKIVDDHLSLSLSVVNPRTLLPGWRRQASFCFVLLNQSGKVLHTTVEKSRLFCAETPSWGIIKVLTLTKLQQDGFMENNKLTIEVDIKVTKVVYEGKSTENEIVVVHGFHVLNSQAVSVCNMFVKHPDVAVDIRSEIREVKTAYMNILLGLVQTLDKPPQSLSETELSNAGSELSELTDAGFKLDWLKSKLEEVSLKRKEPSSALKIEPEKENNKSATAAAPPRVSPFECIRILIKKFFLACF